MSSLTNYNAANDGYHAIPSEMDTFATIALGDPITELEWSTVNIDWALEPEDGKDFPATCLEQAPVKQVKKKCFADTSLLHRLCQAFPRSKVVIETALLLDQEAITRPVAGLPVLAFTKATGMDGKICPIELPKMKNAKTLKSKKNSQKKKRITRKDFQYPINIAINNGATVDVVRVLAHAAPEVLLKPEGSQGLTTLQIALMKQPKNHELIQVLLEANSLAAFALTKRKDTLLHMACQKGSPLSVVKALYNTKPSALKENNFHGETPTQVAERTIICGQDVVDFLGSKYYDQH